MLTQRRSYAKRLLLILGGGFVLACGPGILLAAEGTLTVSLVPVPVAGSGEYVELSFAGPGTLDLAGWRIEDELATPAVVFTFPLDTILQAGDPLRVCQGALSTPAQAPCDFHAGGTAVWNNGGDTLRLFSDSNSEVATLSYTTPAVGEVLETAVVVQVEEVSEPEPEPEEPTEPLPEPEEPTEPEPTPELEPVTTPRSVRICKATNNHYLPFMSLSVPTQSLVTSRIIGTADIVPAYGNQVGSNLDERYNFGNQILTGEQILAEHCRVERIRSHISLLLSQLVRAR